MSKVKGHFEINWPLQTKDLSAQSGKEMGHMAIETLVVLKSEFARFGSQVLAKAQELRIGEPRQEGEQKQVRWHF